MRRVSLVRVDGHVPYEADGVARLLGTREVTDEEYRALSFWVRRQAGKGENIALFEDFTDPDFVETLDQALALAKLMQQKEEERKKKAEEAAKQRKVKRLEKEAKTKRELLDKLKKELGDT